MPLVLLLLLACSVRALSPTLITSADGLRHYIESTAISDFQLDSDISPLLLNRSIGISRRITITGPGVLDMQGASRAFELGLAGELELRNLTLRNGSAGSETNGGGCIAMLSQPVSSSAFVTPQRLEVYGCEFEQCQAQSGNGGAILVSAPFFSKVYIAHTRFTENSAAESGGAIHFAITGDAALGEEFIIEHTMFERNSARAVKGHGGAIAVESAALLLRFSHLLFRNNTASRGTALSMQESVSMERSVFEPSVEVNATSAFLIALLNERCVLELDEFTSDEGVDAPNRTVQVQRIVFTPAPHSSTTTYAPSLPLPPSTLRPSPAPSTRAPSAEQEGPAQGNTYTGVIIALSILFGLLILFFILHQKRKQDAIARLLMLRRASTNRELDSFAAMEDAHNDQLARRRGPRVLNITDAMLFPYDAVGADATCPICLETAAPCTWDEFQKASPAISRGNLDDITLQNTFCRLTACSHLVHTACLIRWVELEDHDQCPYCRASVKPDLRQRWASTSGNFEPVIVHEGQAQARRSAQADDLRQENGSLVPRADC